VSQLRSPAAPAVDLGSYRSVARDGSIVGGFLSLAH
jgi:hypothetical protein